MAVDGVEVVHPLEGHALVAIVGAGPVGLALALGLARQGVRSVELERKDRTSERSKAPVIHVRTRQVGGDGTLLRVLPRAEGLPAGSHRGALRAE